MEKKNTRIIHNTTYSLNEINQPRQPNIVLTNEHNLLMFRYNAIIHPLRPRLSRFKTIVIATSIWIVGEYFLFVKKL